ncbi:MAG: GntR family transcriptional regulator [Sedimentisphaeraceae bacterium JB056]
MSKITVKNQAQKAYIEIRKHLMARSLKPGERLTEKNWSEKLGVNRADVKQAFSRLLGEGLLMTGAKGGFFVKEFTNQELEELLEIRSILETAAAKRALTHATKEEIDELEKISNLMLEMARNNYYMGFKEADLHFHETLVKSSHNKKLEQIYMMANLPISGGTEIRDKSEHLLETDALKHIDMVKALRNRDETKLISLTQSQF